MSTDQYTTTTNPTSATSTRDDPDALRRDIDSTRQGLSRDVDALTEKVTPSKVVGRRIGRMRGAVGSARERVMGATTDKAGSAASSMSDTASSAFEPAVRKTEGNPLAAGLIAFGVGWLASSLLPATQKEQQMARAVEENVSEHATAVTEPLKEAAGQAASNLTDSAKEAASAVQDKASEAASTVSEQTRSTGENSAV